MKTFLPILLAFAGCAHVQGAAPTHCGNVQGFDVKVQYPDLLTCKEARGHVLVESSIAGTRAQGWTILFVGVSAGFAFSNTPLGFAPVDGKTFRATNTVWVSSMLPHVLRHELRHVRDIELGTSTVVDR